MPDPNNSDALLWRQKWFWGLFFCFIFCGIGAQVLGVAIGNRGENIFWRQFLLGDSMFAWLWPVLWLGAVPLSKILGRWDLRGPGNWLQRNIAVVCASSMVFAVFLTHFSAFWHAYTPDELSAILQARTFASGHLTPRVAPELVELVTPKLLQGDTILTSRQSGFYSPGYWPGFALLMTPFAWFHVEWLCNPVLTALSLYLLFLITRRLCQSGEAGVWAVIFAGCSAQIALGAATFYAMPSHLLANLLFCWFFIQNTRRGAFWAGIMGGFALILHNPVPHFSFALPWILWMIRHRRAHLGPLLLGYCILALPIGLGWSAHLQLFDAGRYSSATVTSAQAATPFSQVVSRVAYVLRSPDSYLLLSRCAAFIKLVVWASPGLLGLSFLGWQEARKTRLQLKATTNTSHHSPAYLGLLGASAACNFAIYLFIHFDQGPGWGFRYLHQSYGAFPILAVFWISSFRGASVQARAVRRFCAALCLLGLLVLPLRALQVRLFMQNIWNDKPPAAPAGASITFIRERGDVATFIQNDPFLRNPNWNLRFVSGAQNERLARRYLLQARRVQSGPWGEIWSGAGFNSQAARW